MNKPREFQADTYHHLYNRGASKQKIFFDFADYRYFKERMLYNKIKYEIEILCYCLMPNHFHIFARQTRQEKLLGKFIGNLTNSYTKTINKKYKRSGVLFEGRTKSKIVYDEKAFPVLTKYILLNPLRAGLCRSFKKYEYSSAKELLGISSDKITDKTILNYFEDIEKFKEYILLEEEMDLSIVKTSKVTGSRPLRLQPE